MEIGGRPLTVGKVTIAVLVLLVGIPIAKVVTRKISHRLFTRIGLEPGAAPDHPRHPADNDFYPQITVIHAD